MAQGNLTTCEVKPTDIHVVTVEEFQKTKATLELEARVAALEKKVTSLIKIVKMLQARVGTK